MKKVLKLVGITTMICAGAAAVTFVAKSIIDHKRELDELDFEEDYELDEEFDDDELDEELDDDWLYN